SQPWQISVAMATFFGPSALTDQGWDSPETRALIQEASQIADQDRRAELYAQVVDTVADQAISIPMAHNRSLNATRVGIEGWIASPLGFSSVSLHSVTKAQ
ncbi:MAG TPA: hypothetical protein PKN52_12740, partial [Trueperaceae bacterium]|nr:hypothetical protein [Trueperaceae bacterium]